MTTGFLSKLKSVRFIKVISIGATWSLKSTIMLSFKFNVYSFSRKYRGLHWIKLTLGISKTTKVFEMAAREYSSKEKVQSPIV